jgi:LmbE family N-acetylglucosaminyl deacetylase
MLFENKRILMLGAHPDDVEYAMGGTINRFKEEFKTAEYIVLSSTLEFQANRGIDSELKTSAKLMGIGNLEMKDYPWMEFHSVRGKIRQYLFEVAKKKNPDLVFIPSAEDVHQDHEVLAQEAFRIFRDVSLLSYEIVRSSLKFNPNLFVTLREEDIEAKLRLLEAYQTQKNLLYFNPDIIRAVAIMRGAHSKQKYAEAFEILRLRL